MNTIDESELKLTYAAYLIRLVDPFKAALAQFPDNTNYALRIANEWPKDPIVIDALSKLKADGAHLQYLPDEGEALKALWDKLHGEYVELKDYIAGMKLYAEMRGYMKKQDAGIVINNQPVNKVIVIKDLGSDEEWEIKAKRQQENLLNVATSRH